MRWRALEESEILMYMEVEIKEYLYLEDRQQQQYQQDHRRCVCPPLLATTLSRK